MAQSTGFSVTISAVDQISRPLGSIGREISQLSRQLTVFQQQSAGGGTSQQTRGDFFGRAAAFASHGSREVGRGLREIGSLARETGEHLSRAFEPLSALAGVGGIGVGLGLAGAAEGLTKLGESAQQMRNLSLRTGVSTQAITSLGNAAVLAGSQAETMASGVETLGQKLYDAALGRDAESIGFFKQFGVGVRDATGHIRTGSQAIGEIADKIKAEKNPLTQGEIAIKAFGAAGIGLLPVLRGGAEGLTKLREEGDKLHGGLSDWVTVGNEFNDAQDRARVATQGFTRALGSELQEALLPTVNKFAEWLGDINNSKEKTETATKVVEALGAAFGIVLVGGIVKATYALTAWWALPAVKFLTGPIGLGLLALEFGTSGGGGGLIPRQATPGEPGPGGIPEDTPEERARRRENQGGITGWIGRNLFGGGGRGPREFTAPIPPLHQPGGKGAMLGPASFDAIARAEGTFGKTGIDYNMLYGGAHAPLTDMNLSQVMGIGRAAGGFQGMPGTIGDAAKALGMDPNATDFTPEVQRRIANWTYQKQGLGAWSGFGTHPEELRRAQEGIVQPGAGGGGILGGLGKLFGIGGAQAAPMPGFGGANFRSKVDLRGVRPELVDIARAASGGLPPGYSVEVTSGARVGGLAGSQHHGGNALDMKIYDPQGNPIANRGADVTGLYGQYARSALGVQQKLYPGLAGKLAWGGNFETSPGSGVPDLMHLDLGGDRGKYGSLGAMGPLPVGGGAPNIGGGAPPLGTGDNGGLVPGGALDSKHSVSIDINGAPQGTRARITDAQGPADATLRTHFAFGAI